MVRLTDYDMPLLEDWLWHAIMTILIVTSSNFILSICSYFLIPEMAFSTKQFWFTQKKTIQIQAIWQKRNNTIWSLKTGEVERHL